MVYFLLSPIHQFIKIGSSDNVEQRCQALQYEWGYFFRLLKVVPGGLAEEKRFHKRFGDHRLYRWEKRADWDAESREYNYVTHISAYDKIDWDLSDGGNLSEWFSFEGALKEFVEAPYPGEWPRASLEAVGLPTRIRVNFTEDYARALRDLAIRRNESIEVVLRTMIDDAINAVPRKRTHKRGLSPIPLK